MKAHLQWAQKIETDRAEAFVDTEASVSARARVAQRYRHEREAAKHPMAQEPLMRGFYDDGSVADG